MVNKTQQMTRRPRFRKPTFSNCFSSTPKCKVGIFKTSGLKNVFEKLPCHGGLVRTESLTVEIKLCFQISSVQCGRGPKQKCDWEELCLYDRWRRFKNS